MYEARLVTWEWVQGFYSLSSCFLSSLYLMTGTAHLGGGFAGRVDMNKDFVSSVVRLVRFFAKVIYLLSKIEKTFSFNNCKMRLFTEFPSGCLSCLCSPSPASPFLAKVASSVVSASLTWIWSFNWPLIFSAYHVYRSCKYFYVTLEL